uniref:Uncharacterized protein n=1 Tax=Chenopodium quinoa TaxID=63459 RepID=A0A803L2M6_CHEQI
MHTMRNLSCQALSMSFTRLTSTYVKPQFTLDSGACRVSVYGVESQPKPPSGNTNTRKLSTSKSDVPAPPNSTGGGGKASLQPKRTPVSDKEMEAILLGGCV